MSTDRSISSTNSVLLDLIELKEFFFITVELSVLFFDVLKSTQMMSWFDETNLNLCLA